MTQPSFFEKHLGQPLSSFQQLDHDQRAGVARNAIPDLHLFVEQARPFEECDAPSRTRALARSLFEAIAEGATAEGSRPAAHGLRERIITDRFLRKEADRDQNVYLGKLFTRLLTRAVPDVIFQPVTIAEAARALRWARHHQVPVTLRGAASTAMGGSVPNDAGLTIDVSRFDGIDIDAKGGVCALGAGARLRTVHQRLAERGLALTAYPSNLGGTLVGWFLTGGIGLNAYGRGRALDGVRTADVILPGGEHVRFHDDGRLDVPDSGGKRKSIPADESARWFESRNLRPLTLADLAGSEGVLGLLTHVTVAVEARPTIGAFLLSFETPDDALTAAEWVMASAGGTGAPVMFGPPANLKFLSGSHLHHVRRVWQDEGVREWRERPSAYSDGSMMPWTRIVSPRELGAVCADDREHAGAYLFVDFLELDDAYRFAVALGECPGSPRVLDAESVRFAEERFRPQQTKRLGPGLLAAEILMPAQEVRSFLPRASRLLQNVGQSLDGEVYFLADGTALVIGGYLTDHRSGAFAVDLMIAPALLDLAIADHQGRPYVLGRWQAAYFGNKFGREGAERIRALKRSLDPESLLNRGVLTGLRLHGPLGAVLGATFVPGVRLLRAIYGAGGLAWLARGARSLFAALPGPARGRGATAVVGARFVAAPPGVELTHADPSLAIATTASVATTVPKWDQSPDDRALHCVNCGECNSVCPIFHESKIRLPQMLTHLGEAHRAGETIPETGSALLDLCMRCGNCEEVCQAGIPHLPLYQVMQQASDRTRPRDRERHSAILAAVRGSTRYTRDFLHIRTGGYHKRSPASLPGVARFLVLRSENDAGPSSTCIHCAACVPVCPTHANRELEGADPRWITTLQDRCIGCGTCVEVCPANHLNGGQTLRVMEAPTRDWFLALEDFERQEGLRPDPALAGALGHADGGRA